MTMSTELDDAVVENDEASPQGEEEIAEPDWLVKERELGLIEERWGEPLMVSEWQNDDQYRSKNGWQGRDLIHDKHSPVRITEYYVKYGEGQGLPAALFEKEEDRKGGVGTTLTGICTFTSRAESHKGYCHGGSMCSVLDDAIGWCAFVATGNCLPWSGFTVQINTQLKKPIGVGSILVVQACITKIERRKVFVQATLISDYSSSLSFSSSSSFSSSDNDEHQREEEPMGVVHASGDGLVILNKGVLPELATRGSLHSWPSSIAMT